MKRIVIYYSKHGNNRYLAQKTASHLNCEIEEIKPFFNYFPFTMFNGNMKLKKIKANLSEYDLVILFGPVWMGKLITPLRSFILKYSSHIKRMAFATCCASDTCDRGSQFGYCKVFAEVENIAHDKCVHYEAFPIPLVLEESQKKNQEIILKTRLSDSNFKGEIVELFNSFIKTSGSIKRD